MTTHALDARHEHSSGGTAVDGVANNVNAQIHWLVDGTLRGAETVATHAGHIAGRSVNIVMGATRKAVLGALGGRER